MSNAKAAELPATRACRGFGPDPATILRVAHFLDRAFSGDRPRSRKASTWSASAGPRTAPPATPNGGA